jgi:hypothetical protein
MLSSTLATTLTNIFFARLSSSSPQPVLMKVVASFVDESDPDFEFKGLMSDMTAKAEKGHWKAATRKLKKLVRRFGSSKVIPAKIYEQVLESCMLNRLQGARASEPARKIIEQMAELGYGILEASGDYCINNCLGDFGPDSTHQGFGGIDTALAIKMALEIAGTPIKLETTEKLAIALAREGSIEDSLALILSVGVDAPALATYAEIGLAITKPEHIEQFASQMPTLMAYAKAAGYDLDSIASTKDGITLLACGIIAAERMDNVALGLRLLTAATKTEGGDKQVVKSSQAANRACRCLHQKGIRQAAVDTQWKLAVKLMTLMLERDLRPSPWVWRSAIAVCAKEKKSKRATGLLLDWIRLYEDGKADQPPISVFNTCMNACEICNEEELTLVVLDAMKKTHDTEGNLISSNIALKRLAKQGNFLACEGIIIGMLQANVEPSVVSYTTAIASCASKENRQAAVAYAWVKRMRSRNVRPNVLTYNTAIAACLDGTLAGFALASLMSREMLVDAVRQLADDDETSVYDQYTNVLPDATTKLLVRQVIEQVEKKWKKGEKRDERIREPLLKIAEFEGVRKPSTFKDGDQNRIKETEDAELELEYSAASSTHRVAEV